MHSTRIPWLPSSGGGVQGRATSAPVLMLADAYSTSGVVAHRATSIAGALGVKLVVSGRDLPAARDQPQLVVLGDVKPTFETVAALINELGVPVLVARQPRPSGSLIAASDLEDELHPVLHESARYARLLGKRVTFMHNAQRARVLGTRGPSRALHALLRKLASSARCDASAVVVRVPSTADALIDLADLDEADIVAIGHRWSPLGARRPGEHDHSVAASIIDRCPTSVLIVPFGSLS